MNLPELPLSATVPRIPPPTAVFFDAVLDESPDGSLLAIQYQGNRVLLDSSAQHLSFAHASTGQIGHVRCSATGWRFTAYLDQSLRRCPELDSAEYLGWRNDSYPDGFDAPRRIVPGEKGKFIDDETELLAIDIPPEFSELCSQFQTTPLEVLRSFIADAAELQNFVVCPRADGYSSRGSDERRIARDYLERAYLPLVT